ncbi:hypothetical protein [Streptomyces sp. NPDC058084]|uniref:hypothetical protein n=1 Tax=Streptomyces sp. NPDC058084 TaxID=3346333 RepID=UPI0036E313D7
MFSSWWSTRWLASACDDPVTCLKEWRLSESGVALLPAGRLWDALAVPESLGYGLLGSIAPGGHTPAGPVLRDRKRHELVLLTTPAEPPGALGQVARHLTTGTWVAVPDPARSVEDLSWLAPPDGSGRLFSPEALRCALTP